MLQDLTWSITILTDQQRVTEARLDALTRDPAGPNPPNLNPANSTVNDQAQARVPPIVQHALPPPITPTNIDPTQVPPVQDPVVVWLHHEHQQHPQAHPDGPYAGQDDYNMGQYAESIVD